MNRVNSFTVPVVAAYLPATVNRQLNHVLPVLNVMKSVSRFRFLFMKAGTCWPDQDSFNTQSVSISHRTKGRGCSGR